jgi:hypothetical protein
MATINYEPVTTGSPTVGVSQGVLTEAEADSALTEAFRAWWRSGHDYGIEFTMATMADAASSSWGNVAMQEMSSEPRQAWNNDASNTWASVTLNTWLNAYVAVSKAYDVLRSLDAGLQMNGGADNARTRAAAKLVQGLAHAQLALVFDQAFILSESVDVSTAMLSLEPYGAVMDSALAFLQDAITAADANTFTLPGHWIEGAPLTDAELSQVAHSYSARFMAEVARTPAERAAADWAGIRGHIAQGITSDFGPIADGGQWGGSAFRGYLTYGSWFRGDYRMLGGVVPNDPETDPTGAYAAWLAEAPADRLPFITETADQRIWDGTGGGYPNPGTYFTYDPNIAFQPARGTYHFSYYAFTRLPGDYGFNPGDFLTVMSTVQMDLLDAEALIQLGQPGAAALINQTRVANGGLSAATDADPDLFDKLAYEKRLETFHLNGALAYFDRRGWGPDLGPTDFGQGLVDGTPHHFPVPGAELDRLGIPNYTFGGAGPAFRIAGQRQGSGAIQVPAAAVYLRGGPVLSPAGLQPRQ